MTETEKERRKMGTTRAFLLGAGTTYFLDPAQGKKRRHVIRNRALRTLRRAGRFSFKKARFGLGHLRGLGAQMRNRAFPRPRSLDDRTVEQRIRSDVLRDVGLSRQDIDIRVEQGVVTLRGHVAGRSLADDLIDRVKHVPGVVDVAAMLRVTA
jgi:hypothetical protein